MISWFCRLWRQTQQGHCQRASRERSSETFLPQGGKTVSLNPIRAKWDTAIFTGFASFWAIREYFLLNIVIEDQFSWTFLWLQSSPRWREPLQPWHPLKSTTEVSTDCPKLTLHCPGTVIINHLLPDRQRLMIQSLFQALESTWNGTPGKEDYKKQRRSKSSKKTVMYTSWIYIWDVWKFLSHRNRSSKFSLYPSHTHSHSSIFVMTARSLGDCMHDWDISQSQEQYQ